MSEIKLEDGRIQIHFNLDDNQVTICFIDRKATHVPFAKATVTSDNFCQALSNMALVECVDITLENLEKVGKKQVVDTMVFEMPNGSFYSKKMAKNIAIHRCPQGWKPDTCFSNQDSFFDRDGKNFARTIIRQWV